MINIVRDRGFKIINGKWQIGNLNDKLTSASFDVFVNLRRKLKPKVQIRERKNLSSHNYKFKYDKKLVQS